MSILSLKKTVLGTALLASALASATPAMADDYRYRGRRGDGDTAAAAVAGGIIGIAIGALIASSGKHNRDRCDDGRCYRRYDDGYGNQYGGYYNGYPQQGGYYGNDGRYYRDGGRYDDDRRPYDRGYRGY